MEYFKSKINKNLEHAKSLGIIYSSKNITDKNIIDYLYKIFMDKTSPYYMIFANSEEYIQNTNWRDISHLKNYKNILMLLKSEEKKEKQRKLKMLAKYNSQVLTELKNEELKIEEEKKNQKQKIKKRREIKKKKVENKVKGLSLNIFKEDYDDNDDDKKKAAINELSLTNELKYQIKMANNDDSKERFKYLLNQIQKLKNYDIKEYVSSLKEDYNHYKGEIKDLLHVKEMEERINNFLYSLSLQREKNIIRKNKLENKFSIKDGIFHSSIIDIEDKKINDIHYIKPNKK